MQNVNITTNDNKNNNTTKPTKHKRQSVEVYTNAMYRPALRQPLDVINKKDTAIYVFANINKNSWGKKHKKKPRLCHWDDVEIKIINCTRRINT